MIVTCEGCDTRFQLDDSRVPPAGARVRCSRCKHSFLVLPDPPGSGAAAHAAAEAAVAAASPTPEGVGDDLPVPRPPPKDDDSEWQFAEASAPAPEPPRTIVAETNPWEEVLADDAPPETRELDTLGSPESWSFVSEEAPPLRPHPPASTPSASASAGAAARGVRSATAAVAPDAASEGAVRAPSHAIEAVGWVVTALLLLAIAHGIDWTGTPAPTLLGQVSLGGGVVAEDLSLRRLENAVTGPVLVVGGALVNRGSETLGGSVLAVRVIGAAGDAVESRGRPPSPPAALRELPPAPARAADPPEPLLSRLAPGERVEFEAVVPGAPAGDAQLELRLEPVREQAALPPPDPVDPAGAATEDSSPPSPLPSSG